MKYVYIGNYLLTTREEKLEFIKYMHVFKKFKIINQKIILNDNSLILELSDDSSGQIAKKSAQLFFKKKEEIQVYIIDKIILRNKEIEIYKNNKLFKKIDI
ncbi:hypothetical protein [Halarcobacter anaerophilus]|jgi:hypothetical protein|uniref:Uncharacterized protein n=1 Tax=Halarcobacter anaerophilus TaxID=877500 RepID=A0A4Q0Y439_9BACT|nr:hypothetical protein [Halarcobacter anaerophilus]QDF29272.1 hypothetical protein AANAER_1798 [Halarcobacter anaerophilus]RXJ64523.1 hypothetical protein CRV06_00775 [Halarcobacter anaerophilus]